MCAYFRLELPYYLIQVPGQGPTNVTDNLNGTVIHAGQPAATSGETCTTDYSASGGPNCCSGKYTLTTWSTSPSGDTSTVTTGKDWGGAKGNCLSGPAKNIDSTLKDQNGIPIPDQAYVEGTGLNYQQIIPSPMSYNSISKRVRTNTMIANYFKPADHLATAGLPLAYTPAGGVSPNPYYTFTCFDRAEKPQASITLMIRDWDLESEFLLGAVGNPDSIGVDGVGYPNNSRADLKDIPTDPVTFPAGFPIE